MTKTSDKSGQRTIFWWIVWIGFTIGSFFVAHAIWTPWIAKHYGSVRETKASIMWIVAVFGTWMVILVPLIVIMYQKVDKAYEDARINREKAALRFRSTLVDKSKRLLADNVQAKLKTLPESVNGGQLVNLTLKDGRRIPNVFVYGHDEILGIYDEQQMSFEGNDVRDAEPVDFKKTPQFRETKWLRLDGAKPE